MENKVENNNDALIQIQTRNAFYKKNFHLMLGVFLLNIIVIIFLINIAHYLYKNSALPVYFVANDNGVLIHESPLYEPLPDNQVTAWLIEAVETANSFDFVNYRSQLQNAQKYFLDTAWAEYMKALTASLNLVAVKERQEVWITKVIQPPKLTNAGVVNGAYAWKYELLAKETALKPPDFLNTPANTRVHTYKITVLIQRKPLLQSYKGLAMLTMLKEEVGTPIRTNILTPSR